jgi:hypothetical protein
MAELLLDAFRHVWAALERLRVPAALMGGLAVAVWQHVRATRDVDLLVQVPEAEQDAILEQLATGGLRPKHEPPVLALGELRILQLLWEPADALMPVQVDLLLADSAYHREAMARRVPATIDGLEVAVLACEDLILHKILAGRIIDRADVAALLRANRGALDVAYLRRWSQDLNLGPALAEVWAEALPEDPVPG